MTQLEQLIEPLKHSSQLPQAVKALQEVLEEERAKRRAFYNEMTPEQKIEFIDGEVVMHSPAKNRHLEATGLIFTLLRAFVDLHDLGSVKSKKCLCAFPRNDYEPDVVYFGPEKSANFRSDTMTFPPPDLAVEVLSDSTEGRDRGVKFDDFAMNGVQEYWIVDTDQQSVEQYVLKDETYVLKLKSGSGDLNCEAITGLTIPVASAFDREQNLNTLRQIVATP